MRGRYGDLGWGPELFTGGGEMAMRLRASDWADHPLGAPASWPIELRSSLDICLRSVTPTAVYWGPDLRLLYNDAWAPLAGLRHPAALGEPAAEVWRDFWPSIASQFEQVTSTRRGLSRRDQMFVLEREGAPEETYWDYGLTPILNERGEVAGIFAQATETTARVMTERTQSLLLEINDRLRELSSGDYSASETLAAVLETLGRRLGLARVGYSQLEAGGERAIVRGNWRSDAVTDIAGENYLMSDFGDGPMTDLSNGQTVFSDDVAEDRRHDGLAAESFARIGIRAYVCAPVVRGGRSIGFLFLNSDRPRRWSANEVTFAREAAERIWFSLERADATARMRESERRFALIFGQASVGMSEVDLNGRFVRVNDSMAKILGRPADEVRGMAVTEVTHPDDVAETRARALDPSAYGDAFALEKRYLRPDGSAVWAVTNATRILDDRNAPTGFFSVTTDVSDRKEQERIRAWLIAELNHRVKNNLSTVQALAHQTRLTTTSREEFEAVFNARLMALSRAHDLLMRETWTSAALGDLIADTLAPYGDGGDARFAIGGPEVRLSPTAAVTLTLAFHELATNAAKFGALSRPEGHVAVAWSLTASESQQALDLSWRESNGPVVQPPTRRGFGLRLIERGAARELGGVARVDFKPDGVACAIQIPLSQKVMAP